MVIAFDMSPVMVSQSHVSQSHNVLSFKAASIALERLKQYACLIVPQPYCFCSQEAGYFSFIVRPLRC